jgi:hypothetical protein
VNFVRATVCSCAHRPACAFWPGRHEAPRLVFTCVLHHHHRRHHHHHLHKQRTSYIVALGLWFAEGWDMGWGDCHVAVVFVDAISLFVGVLLHLWAIGRLPASLGQFALHCVLLSPGTALAGELRKHRQCVLCFGHRVWVCVFAEVCAYVCAFVRCHRPRVRGR